MPVLMPAAVTPMLDDGSLDIAGLIRLFGWFQAARVDGIVLAGTNGEGPSLGPYEKKELITAGAKLKGDLRLLLGVATPSTEEAKWLAKQTYNAGGDGILLMPPGYFRNATWAGVEAWLREAILASPIPVWIYNFPKMTGIAFPPEGLERLASLENLVGLKDSSGDVANLTPFRESMPGRELLVGDETIWPQAWAAGWQGSISGACNSLAPALRAGIDKFGGAGAGGDSPTPCPLPVPKNGEGVLAPYWSLVAPLIEAVRAVPQPMGHKALLHKWGILPSPAVRLPLLQTAEIDALERQIVQAIGPIGA